MEVIVVGRKCLRKVLDRLDTIHKDMDTANMTTQYYSLTSLAVEWAHQRLPLPIYWSLSPISTINSSKRGDRPSASNTASRAQDITGFLEVARGGLFFLLGIEVMAAFVFTEIQSPVRSVPIAWKLHSLSVVLLLGMGVLEEEKSRDVYETLQELYGKFLDELWSSKSKNSFWRATRMS